MSSLLEVYATVLSYNEDITLLSYSLLYFKYIWLMSPSIWTLLMISTACNHTVFTTTPYIIKRIEINYFNAVPTYSHPILISIYSCRSFGGTLSIHGWQISLGLKRLNTVLQSTLYLVPLHILSVSKLITSTILPLHIQYGLYLLLLLTILQARWVTR